MSFNSERSWEAKARHFESLWRAALNKDSMCADHAKGLCNFEIKWVEGSTVGSVDFKNWHSDAVEQKLTETARAVVCHARITGRAVVTITVEAMPPHDAPVTG